MLRGLGKDDGFAMVAVMGVVALITVVAVGGYFVAQQTLHESQRVEGESKAFQVAQSGLERELASFSTAKLVSGNYSVQGSTPDGTYSVTATQVSGFEYIMTSAGDAEDRQESVTQRFFYLNLWDMNIGAGQSAPLGGGRGFNGNAAIRGPLYIKGDFDFTNANATYEGGPLMVKGGDIIVGGSATIGDASPIDLFLDGNITGTKPESCHYKSWSTSVPDIELPWIDDDYMDAMLQSALDESTDNYQGYTDRNIPNVEASGGDPATYDDGTLTDYDGTPIVRSKAPGAASHYKYVGNGGRSAMGNGSTNLSIGSTSFGAWDYGSSGVDHDDFAFDAGTGTLYVEGVVFIDGDLTLTNNVSQYVGNGTLVVNGDTFIEGTINPDTTNGDMDAANCVGISCPGDITIDGGRWNGAVFCNGEVGLYQTFASFKGSMLCDTIFGDKPNILIETDPNLPQFVPRGMPALGGILFPGNWSRN